MTDTPLMKAARAYLAERDAFDASTAPSLRNLLAVRKQIAAACRAAGPDDLETPVGQACELMAEHAGLEPATDEPCRYGAALLLLRLAVSHHDLLAAIIDLRGDKGEEIILHDGSCVHCGRDYKGDEPDRCIDDCPGEIATVAIERAKAISA